MPNSVLEILSAIQMQPPPTKKVKRTEFSGLMDKADRIEPINSSEFRSHEARVVSATTSESNFPRVILTGLIVHTAHHMLSYEKDMLLVLDDTQLESYRGV